MTIPTDWSYNEHTVHKYMKQIKDLEFKLTSSFNYNFELETNDSHLAGEGIMYLGFEPKKSDLFLYQFGDTNDPLLNKAISLITGTTLSTRATKPVTDTRSITTEENVLPKKSYKFEMYDDVRGEDIRNLMKK